MTSPDLTRHHTDLRKLDISGNEVVFSEADVGVYKNLASSLLHLNLARNKLSTLSFVTHFTNLRYLDASSNLIAALDASTFSQSPHLSHVDLSMNSLSSLEPAFFSPLQPVLPVHLNLSRNLISTVPRCTFRYVPLSSLILDHNPLPCDCSAQWLLSLAQDTLALPKPTSFTFSLVCSLPTTTQDQQLSDALSLATCDVNSTVASCQQYSPYPAPTTIAPTTTSIPPTTAVNVTTPGLCTVCLACWRV